MTSDLELLRRMLLIRRFEERTLELQEEGKVHGAVHPSIGQEASAVGVCSVLEPDDRIVSTHRGHGHCIAKGARVDRMMAELFGRADGYCKGKGGSMHVAAFDVGILGANGIVAVMPFSCMPGIVTAAIAPRLRRDLDNIPWLDISFELQKSTNIQTRLEAFMSQAKHYQRLRTAVA